MVSLKFRVQSTGGNVYFPGGGLPYERYGHARRLAWV